MKRVGKEKRLGFTLVEVMTVVAIVGLIAAMSMPNLLRAKNNANEAAAQATLKTINAALESYYFIQAPPSYPTDLSVLASMTPPYLTTRIASSSASTSAAATATTGLQGYVYLYQPVTTGTRVYSYSLAALPKTENVTGGRYFAINTTGVVFQTTKDNPTGAVTTDPPAGFKP